MSRIGTLLWAGLGGLRPGAIVPLDPPALSVEDQQDADSAVATVAGEVGATVTIYYTRKLGSLPWTLAGQVEGSGQLTVTGLMLGQTYCFMAFQELLGQCSPPSPLSYCLITAGVSTTPWTGSISAALEGWKNLLANSATFQVLAGVGSAEEAKLHIRLARLPHPGFGKHYRLEEMQAYRPYWLIWNSAAAGLVADLETSDPGYADSGRLIGQLTLAVDEDLVDTNNDITDPNEATLRAANAVGGIFEDLKSGSGQAGRLLFQKLTVQGPHETDPAEAPGAGPEMWADFIADWGPSSLA